jgi:hypothetical protein
VSTDSGAYVRDLLQDRDPAFARILEQVIAELRSSEQARAELEPANIGTDERSDHEVPKG